MTTYRSMMSLNGTDVEEWRFDSMGQRLFIVVCLVIISITGFIGNLIVILAILFSSKLQTTTNTFVMNLAVADLLNCITLPLTALFLASEKEIGMEYPGLCMYVGFMMVLVLSTSIVTHGVIAFIRYVRVTQSSATFMSIFSRRRIIILVICVWMYAAIDPVISICGVAPPGYNPKYRICTRDIRQPSSIWLSSIRSFYVNVVVVVVVAFSYSKIFLFIRRHNHATLQRINDFSSRLNRSEEKIPKNDLDRHCKFSVIHASNVALKDNEGMMYDKHEKCGGRYNGKFDRCKNKQEPSLVLEDASSFNEKSKSDVIGEAHMDQIISNNKTVNETLKNTNIEPLHEQQIDITRKEPQESFKDCETQNQKKFKLTPPETFPMESEISQQCPTPVHIIKNENQNPQIRHTNHRVSGHIDDEPKVKLKHIDITKKLFLVMIVFNICVTPYFFFLVVHSLERLLPYAATLLAAGSCVNPILYGLVHPQFKVPLKCIITCRLSSMPKPSKLLKWIMGNRIRSLRN